MCFTFIYYVNHERRREKDPNRWQTPNAREQVNMIFLLVRTSAGLPDPAPTHRLYICANLALGIPQTTVIWLAGEAKQNIKYVCDPPKQDPFLFCLHAQWISLLDLCYKNFTNRKSGIRLQTIEIIVLNHWVLCLAFLHSVQSPYSELHPNDFRVTP
jgi:hypothetical protein